MWQAIVLFVNLASSQPMRLLTLLSMKLLSAQISDPNFWTVYWKLRNLAHTPVFTDGDLTLD